MSFNARLAEMLKNGPGRGRGMPMGGMGGMGGMMGGMGGMGGMSSSRQERTETTTTISMGSQEEQASATKKIEVVHKKKPGRIDFKDEPVKETINRTYIPPPKTNKPPSKPPSSSIITNKPKVTEKVNQPSIQNNLNDLMKKFKSNTAQNQSNDKPNNQVISNPNTTSFQDNPFLKSNNQTNNTTQPTPSVKPFKDNPFLNKDKKDSLKNNVPPKIEDKKPFQDNPFLKKDKEKKEEEKKEVKKEDTVKPNNVNDNKKDTKSDDKPITNEPAISPFKDNPFLKNKDNKENTSTNIEEKIKNFQDKNDKKETFPRMILPNPGQDNKNEDKKENQVNTPKIEEISKSFKDNPFLKNDTKKEEPQKTEGKPKAFQDNPFIKNDMKKEEKEKPKLEEKTKKEEKPKLEEKTKKEEKPKPEEKSKKEEKPKPEEKSKKEEKPKNNEVQKETQKPTNEPKKDIQSNPFKDNPFLKSNSEVEKTITSNEAPKAFKDNPFIKSKLSNENIQRLQNKKPSLQQESSISFNEKLKKLQEQAELNASAAQSKQQEQMPFHQPYRSVYISSAMMRKNKPAVNKNPGKVTEASSISDKIKKFQSQQLPKDSPNNEQMSKSLRLQEKKEKNSNENIPLEKPSIINTSKTEEKNKEETKKEIKEIKKEEVKKENKEEKKGESHQEKIKEEKKEEKKEETKEENKDVKKEETKEEKKPEPTKDNAFSHVKKILESKGKINPPRTKPEPTENIENSPLNENLIASSSEKRENKEENKKEEKEDEKDEPKFKLQRSHKITDDSINKSNPPKNEIPSDKATKIMSNFPSYQSPDELEIDFDNPYLYERKTETLYIKNPFRKKDKELDLDNSEFTRIVPKKRQRKQADINQRVSGLNCDYKKNFAYLQVLLDYNIIDFTLTYEFCKKLKNEIDPEKYKGFFEMFIDALKSKAKPIKENSPYIDVSILQNYLVFFMVVTINLKDESEYVYAIFDKHGKKVFKKIIDIILSLPTIHQRLFLGIISYIFQKEYVGLFYYKNDKKLEEIFLTQYQKFSKTYTGNLSSLNKETYLNMFNRLLIFDFSYDYFFQNNRELALSDDASSYKLCIAQSVIRVAFSKEKSSIMANEEFFEFKFLSTVIEKDMKETFERFGDDVKTLFRKEDLCDDIIKYMFFIFGNSMLIESFIKPVSEFISKEKESKKNVVLSTANYEFIMNSLIDKITLSIPLVLKILLKLVFVFVKKYFSVEEENYSQLYTLLFFNYIISPRVQFIYDITEDKVSFLKDLNRLIRNTCYNNQFNKIDPLSGFNEKIPEYNNKLKSFVVNNILSIDIEDETVQKSLSELFTEKYLIYPKFLFYLDSLLICNASRGGLDKLIEYSQLEQS